MLVAAGATIVVLGGMISLWSRASSALHPLPRDYALSLVEPLYDFLCGDSTADNHYLLSLAPNGLERVALARVVASLSQSIVECNPRQVRRLSKAWGLEEVLVWRITHFSGRKRLEALEVLLWLHPREEYVRKVVRHTFASPSAAFGQLLLVLYCVPERALELVARHHLALSWEDVGRVVEVLKMHFAQLPEPEGEGLYGANVDMLLLRLAAVEGVGDAVALARRLTASKDRALRDAALNILLEESLFPAMTQSEMECS